MTTADHVIFAVTLAAALGCGLIAGVFFAFSAFVMKALARLPVAAGVAAMQSINVIVLNPLFLGVFIGTAVACLAAMVAALSHWRDPGSVYRLVGGALYMIGTFAVTRAFNVPRNEALASVNPADPDAAGHWSRYVAGWTAWNHVRTAAALAAAAALSVALAN